MNISIELWGVAFCVIAIACTLLLARGDARYRNLLVAMFALNLVEAGGDAAAGVFRGQAGDAAWIATHAGNFIVFAAGFLLAAASTAYLCARLEDAGAPPRTGWVRGVLAGAVVMCVLAASGAFYSIDGGNLYHRSGLHWVAGAFAIAVDVVNIALILKSRRALEAPALGCLLFYTVVPTVMIGWQIFVYGLNLSVVAGTAGLVVLLLETQAHSARMLQQRTEELARSQTEAAEGRIALMVSQIQPHFLFNALDSIYHLIAEDPLRAQRAVDDFSTYLRANLDALGRAEPVPIEAELRHVRTYLELEKVSMEELLEYEIDVPVAGFKVPALSVQTLAENAVKHGVAKKPAGGKVVVRTGEQDGCCLVSVSDDGVGFDPSDAACGAGHIGIANTRARLAAMCGGVLEVTSAPGRGSTAVMRVPRTVPGETA